MFKGCSMFNCNWPLQWESCGFQFILQCTMYNVYGQVFQYWSVCSSCFTWEDQSRPPLNNAFNKMLEKYCVVLYQMKICHHLYFELCVIWSLISSFIFWQAHCLIALQLFHIIVCFMVEHFHTIIMLHFYSIK